MLKLNVNSKIVTDAGKCCPSTTFITFRPLKPEYWCTMKIHITHDAVDITAEVLLLLLDDWADWLWQKTLQWSETEAAHGGNHAEWLPKHTHLVKSLCPLKSAGLEPKLTVTWWFNIYTKTICLCCQVWQAMAEICRNRTTDTPLYTLCVTHTHAFVLLSLWGPFFYCIQSIFPKLNHPIFTFAKPKPSLEQVRDVLTLRV